MKMFRFLLAAFAVGCLAPAVSSAQTKPSAGMIRFADVSADKIVFSYADDLWIVARDGGVASPLASPVGSERFPRFSPDGKSIAFSGNYDGGSDIYRIDVSGGPAERVTYHPAGESFCDWTPNGKGFLFSSNGFAGLGRAPALYTIHDDNPIPTQLPVPYGTNGALSADGKWLAYTPYSRDTRTWKRYRGGMASDIWLFNLEDNTSKQITNFEGTDSLPMWNDDTVYYLSDAGASHRLNVWKYETKSGEREQVTKFEDFDCKWPSMGPGSDGKGEIIVQNGSGVYLVNLTDGAATEVAITIPGDRPKLRKQKIDASEFVTDFDISATGKRVTISARGDIWTAPVENGSPRNLTRTSGAFERDPAWSPDGRWIAYFSDESGEYQLYVTQSDGRGETKQLTSDRKNFLYSPVWSPDSKHLLFSDNTGLLLLHTIESGDTKEVDQEPSGQPLSASWSHDGSWLTYANSSTDRGQTTSVWVYKVADGSRKQLTGGFFSDSAPTFDNKGEYIFFASSRHFESPKYEDLGTTFIYSGTEVLIAMPLRSDVEHPFLAKIDEEEWEEEESEDEKEGDEEPGDRESSDEDDEKSPSDDASSESNEADEEDSDEKSNDDSEAESGDDEEGDEEPFEIEFDGIEARAFQLPVGNGSFGSLVCNDKNQLLYVQSSGRGSGQPPAIKLFDLSDDEREAKTVVSGVGGFAITADGKKLLVVRGEDAFVVSAAAGQKLEDQISTNGMDVMIDPREEWKQVFHDAWRLERDFFYDPTMHGVDWDGIKAHYEPMLEDCVTRSDLSFIIREMISELNVGHAYYRETDLERGDGSDVGLLGCRFELDGDAYKIAELYQGADWDVDARNPLVSAGVKSGQYILEVNGMPLTAEQNPYSAFAGLAGRTVSITFSDDAKLDDEDKRVAVRTMRSDNNLRFRAWIEKNRKYVEEKSDGKVGYIYVVNTGVPGQNDLVRMFYGQIGKEALIVDDRWNGGGQIPTRFIELLNRPITNYWAIRNGRDWSWPPDSHQGPKCMLINGMAGSGGDMFPALFKQNKLGKLIGLRTWGGLVGISGGPGLVDGSGVTMPSFAYYEKDGTWGIEGHGVDPDLKIVDDPAKMVDGGDPQLDAAIEEMLKEIEAGGYNPPQRPAYPDRSKFGLDPKDK
jgi:tricorn protease